MKHIRPFPQFSLDEQAELLDKILHHVDRIDHVYREDAPWTRYPCLLFQGKWHDGKGFKKIKFGGHTLYVHRVTFELHVGTVPEGLLLDHLCRHHGCCQFQHLEPVTTKENILRGSNRNFLLRRGARPPIIGMPASVPTE